VFRENSHLDLALPLDSLQALAAEWGRRLKERGILDNEDDVFDLTYDEVREWLTGPSPGLDAARELLVRRRATYRVVNKRWQEERFPAVVARKVLRGTGVSPGRAKARARIVMGEHQFHRLRPGEVMVCPHTSPSWTPLFTVASAVVAETGGAASHAAIVAREYGIPAVMAVAGATSLLQEGDEVTVDGSRGIVGR
jgi:pyruvate,water dikinase